MKSKTIYLVRNVDFRNHYNLQALHIQKGWILIAAVSCLFCID